jgi:hypothetical protein
MDFSKRRRNLYKIFTQSKDVLRDSTTDINQVLRHSQEKEVEGQEGLEFKESFYYCNLSFGQTMGRLNGLAYITKVGNREHAL